MKGSKRGRGGIGLEDVVDGGEEAREAVAREETREPA